MQRFGVFTKFTKHIWTVGYIELEDAWSHSSLVALPAAQPAHRRVVAFPIAWLERYYQKTSLGSLVMLACDSDFCFIWCKRNTGEVL